MELTIAMAMMINQGEYEEICLWSAAKEDWIIGTPSGKSRKMDFVALDQPETICTENTPLDEKKRL